MIYTFTCTHFTDIKLGIAQAEISKPLRYFNQIIMKSHREEEQKEKFPYYTTRQVTGQTTDMMTYWGTDKSLARPGRKQTSATEDFDVHIFYL
jgi:hypothetical protein